MSGSAEVSVEHADVQGKEIGLFPAVTIVIPTYNDVPLLRRSIESALCQTYPYIKILIIDDAGPAQGKAWVEENYGHLNTRIQAIRHQYNRMLGGARNTGIDAAETKYLFFLDADDELLPDAIEKLYKAAERSGSDVVQGGTLRVKKSGYVHIFHHAEFEACGGLEGLELFSRHAYASLAWNKLYNLDMLIKNRVRFAEKFIHEDVVFACKTAFFSKKISSFKDPIVKYYETPGSITSRGLSDLSYESYIQVFLELFESFKCMKIDADKFPNIAWRITQSHVFNDFVPKLLHARENVGDQQFSRSLMSAFSKVFGSEGIGVASLVCSALVRLGDKQKEENK